MGCTHCCNWIHIPCTEFSNTKEAEKHERIFKCKKCVKGGESSKNKENKDVPNGMGEKGYSGVWEDAIADPKFIGNITDTDLKSLEDGQWVTDNVLTLALIMMQQSIDKRKKKWRNAQDSFRRPKRNTNV